MPLCPLATGTQTEVQSGAFPGTHSSLGWGGAGLEPGPLEWCSRPSPYARPRAGARPPAPERAGRALCRRRPMSGATPRTARAARKGVCARASGPAPRGARSARAPQRAREQVLGARSRSARPRAAPPSSALPPARAPRLSCTSFACRQSSRVCARGRRRGRSVGGGGGEGACRSAARAGRPRPCRRRTRAQGNKGTRWVLRTGHVHVCAPGAFAGTEREVTHPYIPNHVEMSFLTQSTHLVTQSKTGTDTMSIGKMAAPSRN